MRPAAHLDLRGDGPGRAFEHDELVSMGTVLLGRDGMPDFNGLLNTFDGPIPLLTMPGERDRL